MGLQAEVRWQVSGPWCHCGDRGKDVDVDEVLLSPMLTAAAVAATINVERRVQGMAVVTVVCLLQRVHPPLPPPSPPNERGGVGEAYETGDVSNKSVVTTFSSVIFKIAIPQSHLPQVSNQWEENLTYNPT
ncbi:hypothetical protein C0Q70_19216 [Pomacea canaliculata]|uniref:Uncharacterized protein n=1 Tax=Pomacea canaliculata TaxID=400727 RepID=A0A2T7NIP6_POMCA|nr:hypothetical protein C0Q70_19216 [Pomacea canaliculata]